jgi:hypothetical protein
MQPPADPPAVVLPAEIQAVPGRAVLLKATSPGKQIRWLLPTAEADLIPFPDGKTAVFAAPKPGRYAVYAWTAAGDVPGEAARCVVVVGEVAPVPPENKFERDLLLAYAAEPSADKPLHAKALAAAYREIEQFLQTGAGMTADAIAIKLRAAVEARLGADALRAVRGKLAEELARRFPADAETPLTAVQKRDLATAFANIAALLERLK